MQGAVRGAGGGIWKRHQHPVQQLWGGREKRGGIVSLPGLWGRAAGKAEYCQECAEKRAGEAGGEKFVIDLWFARFIVRDFADERVG